MTKRSATSIVDITKRSVLARVEIAAPPERVWKAITEDVASWWGSDTTYQTTKHEVDLRVGGAYRSEGSGANGPFHVSGTIVELEPPRKYAVTWQPSWSSEPPSTVTYVLEPIAGGTRLTLSHTGFTDPASCESHGEGWTRVLEWLSAHVRPRVGYYFLRLVTPRPTFPADATPVELAAMASHAAYWRASIEAGVGVLFGPVADPTGVWGLGVIAARDDAEVRAFIAEDPAILAGLGFRYEQLPMLSAIVL